MIVKEYEMGFEFSHKWWRSHPGAEKLPEAEQMELAVLAVAKDPNIPSGFLR
jgi:hypothetical protein